MRSRLILNWCLAFANVALGHAPWMPRAIGARPHLSFSVTFGFTEHGRLDTAQPHRSKAPRRNRPGVDCYSKCGDQRLFSGGVPVHNHLCKLGIVIPEVISPPHDVRGGLLLQRHARPQACMDKDRLRRLDSEGQGFKEGSMLVRHVAINDRARRPVIKFL